MQSRLEQIINSSSGLNLAAAMARATPPKIGYKIAGQAARIISSHPESRLVKTVRTNQWVVSGEKLGKEALDQATRSAFLNMARSIYDLYHYLHDPEAAGRLFVIEPSVQRIVDRPEFSDRGLVVAGLHMSNFDLALQSICMHRCKPLALTIPNPEGGRRLEYEIRKRTGLNLVPATVSGLRQAIRHLRQGGVVVTGIDHPQFDYQPRPRFFGRPACLPTHYISLALMSHVPIRIVISRQEEDGKNHILSSPSIEMDPYPSRAEELLCNAEKVLTTAESFIRQTPHQWAISQPVWPEAINLVP